MRAERNVVIVVVFVLFSIFYCVLSFAWIGKGRKNIRIYLAHKIGRFVVKTVRWRVMEERFSLVCVAKCKNFAANFENNNNIRFKHLEVVNAIPDTFFIWHLSEIMVLCAFLFWLSYKLCSTPIIGAVLRQYLTTSQFNKVLFKF